MILDLHVQPGASRTEFAGRHGERIKVRITARAADGKANEALIQFLAAHFGVPRRSITIISGAKSRTKRVAIEGAQEWKMPKD